MSICVYTKTHHVTNTLKTLLSGQSSAEELTTHPSQPSAHPTSEEMPNRYQFYQFEDQKEFLEFVEQHKEEIDCLILQNVESELGLLNYLYDQGILLPVVIIESKQSANANAASPQRDTPHATHYLYHTGEVWLLSTQLEQIVTAIDNAIARFLQLAPSSNFPLPTSPTQTPQEERKQNFLMLQQRRLADKLKERLGYLGIYYKRNPQDFYRNLPPQDKQQLRRELSEEYREIIINYFTPDYPLNPLIDQFVNHAFFADISVSQILEIHMELIDAFAQQLKLEGRSEEILLDYRLALIDIIAHLCEMYRRSIPRENIPFELFAANE
ncbi:circadian clock protein KaiA [Spirulina sp. CS-785/01]|nr:circadian clock protein KaiA [Spirulina sp. CS-785/01]MDB9312691.1 circadian clock protein KaiA [Spirulina sp. CS-785/01]